MKIMYLRFINCFHSWIPKNLWRRRRYKLNSRRIWYKRSFTLPIVFGIPIEYGRKEWKHFCGATLITESHAISALHCFVVQVEMSRKISGDELYFKDFRVVAGKYYKNPITLNKNAQVSTLMLQLSDYS